MCSGLGETFVHELAGVLLEPPEQTIEPLGVLNLRLRGHSLQSTDENCSVDSGVHKISNGAEQRHVELMKLWIGEFLGGTGKLRVCNRSKGRGELGLIKGNFHRFRVLDVLDPTVRERVPVYLQFPEDFLNLGEDEGDNRRFAGDLQIVDVLRHHACQPTGFMPEAKLGVDKTGDQSALAFRDHS